MRFGRNYASRWGQSTDERLLRRLFRWVSDEEASFLKVNKLFGQKILWKNRGVSDAEQYFTIPRMVFTYKNFRVRRLTFGSLCALYLRVFVHARVLGRFLSLVYWFCLLHIYQLLKQHGLKQYPEFIHLEWMEDPLMRESLRLFSSPNCTQRKTGLTLGLRFIGRYI